MSRSRRKSPFVPIMGRRNSMKSDKRKANKALRKEMRHRLNDIQTVDDAEEYIDLNLNDVSNAYTFAHEAYSRLDVDDEDFDKYMRK